MSVELGNKSKTVKYLNIHKEGRTAEDFIAIDNRWTSPILDKQSDYLVAISRFEVPLNRVPVTQKMENCIQIFKYNDTIAPVQGEAFDDTKPLFHLNGGNYESDEGRDMDPAIVDEYFNKCEQYKSAPELDSPNLDMTSGADAYTIDMEPCHTIFEFVKKLNAQIQEALLFNQNTKAIIPPQYNGAARGGSASFPNMFTAMDDQICNTSDPIARFSVQMSADYTFSVAMNSEFAKNYYIKMSVPLFNMLQFKTIQSDTYERINLVGRRFMAHRTATLDLASLRVMATTIKPPYSMRARNVQSTVPKASAIQDILSFARNPKLTYGTEVIREFVTTFTAAVSAADSINRIKSIVFTSSLATLSEGVSGGGYRRALTDFVIPTVSSFNWNVSTLQASSISENAASEYSYQNNNPSSGRLLIMSDPSPLYELKIEAKVKVWDFEKEQFELEPIPLPQGSTFSCKLVFLSRNDPHERERPDGHVGH